MLTEQNRTGKNHVIARLWFENLRIVGGTKQSRPLFKFQALQEIASVGAFLRFRHFLSRNDVKAFTLAEVLITLGIIGIVAAMTIPTLVNNASEHATVSKLKEVYAILSQAYTLAVQDNGTPDTWGSTAPVVLDKIKPYLKVTKDCTDYSTGCFPSGIMYRLLSGGNNEVFDSMSVPKLRLSNGTNLKGHLYSANCSTVDGPSLMLQNVCGRYDVDLNGDKPPNQWGKDVFDFYLTKYGIMPTGSALDTLYKFADYCKDKTSSEGTACTSWIIYNGNRDYLHCNNLDWGVKTTCK